MNDPSASTPQPSIEAPTARRGSLVRLFLRLGLGLILIAIFLIWAILAFRSHDPVVNHSGGVLQGLTFSPKASDATNQNSFFLRANDLGTLIEWVGDYKELDEPSTGAYATYKLIKAKKLTPVMIGVIKPEDIAHPGAEEAIKRAFTQFAASNQPPYLGIGNEVNSTIEEKDAQAYKRYLSIFDAAAQSVKAVSPNTQVFPVFQLERLRGLRGGLFGGQNDESQAGWSSLSAFPKADLLAFTTYPGLIYHQPEDIPTNYYSQISLQTDKPVAFTEVGWFRVGPVGWESSADEQARFIERFTQLTRAIKPSFRIWSFLFDQPTFEPFKTMGLLGPQENDSPAYQAWKSFANVK